MHDGWCVWFAETLGTEHKSRYDGTTHNGKDAAKLHLIAPMIISGSGRKLKSHAYHAGLEMIIIARKF